VALEEEEGLERGVGLAEAQEEEQREGYG